MCVSLKTRKEHNLHEQMRGEGQNEARWRADLLCLCHVTRLPLLYLFSAFPESISLLRALALWPCKGSEQHQQCGVDEGHVFYTHRRTEKKEALSGVSSVSFLKRPI